MKTKLDGEKKRQKLKHTPPLFFLRLNFTPLVPAPLRPPPHLPGWCKGMRSRGLWGQSTAVPFCYSFLTPFPCGCSPQAVFLYDKHAPARHPSWAAVWKSAPTCPLHWLQGNICSSVVSSTGCKGISALVPRAPSSPPPPSSLTLIFTGLYLTLIFLSPHNAVSEFWPF